MNISVTDAGGLTVSFIALGVAVYGVFERQRAVYANVRVRITEILDDLEELSFEEDKYVEAEYAQADEHEGGQPPLALARSSLTGRRALLTSQALALVDRLTRSRFGRTDELHLTPSEYVSLAYSLVRLGELTDAQAQYEAALASNEQTTNSVRIAAHVGLADCLFDLGQQEEGRKHFAVAVTSYPASDPGRQAAFGLCIDRWLPRELHAGNEGAPAEAVHVGRAILDRATDVRQPPAWALDGQMALRRRATQTVYVDGRYAEEVVGYEDVDP